MRLKDVLDDMGLPYTEVAWNNPPDETYAIYVEEVTRRGADTMNCITEREVSVEVYSHDFYDGEAVRAVERVLDRHCIAFTKYETSYINSEHLYQTRFEFSLTSKDEWSERFKDEQKLDWDLEGPYGY